MLRFFYLFSLLILCSCSFTDQSEKLDFLEDPSHSLKEKLTYVLSNEYLSKMGYSEQQQDWLNTYYKSTGYTPLWINDSMISERGSEMKLSLEKSLWFGIPNNRQIIKQKKLNWIEQEVYMTSQIALLMCDLRNGYIDFENNKYKPEELLSHVQFDSLTTAFKAGETDSLFLSVREKDTSYHFLADGLYQFCKEFTLDKRTYSFEPQSVDSLAFKGGSNQALINKGYLKEKDRTKIEAWKEAIKLLQRQHGLSQNGHLDQHTCRALNESNLSKVLRAAISLDRYRQATSKPKKFIKINLPGFDLVYYADDTLRSTHRIIIGKPENPTPTLQSSIRTIVVYPYWNVPYSIAKKEILPAVKRNVNYLDKNRYKIYQNDKVIDPHSVKWRNYTNFPFKIVQDPGPENSLGIIKFEFSNSYSVYVHDTPSKSLFNNQVRTYSHGCMRCKDPVDLGKKILLYDSVPYKRNPMTADSLDTLLHRAKNFPIRLIEPIPIFVEYNTVSASKEGVVFHFDVYKKEDELIGFMEK